MAQIRTYPFVRHLRAEPTAHVVRHRAGRQVAEGAGLAFWFRPLATAVSEVPVDDREATLHATARTRDFQDVAVDGAVVYRVADPRAAATRIDFSLDLGTGRHHATPVEQLEAAVVGAATEAVHDHLAEAGLADVLAAGAPAARARIAARLAGDAHLRALGVEAVAVRVDALRASPETQRALEAPTRERVLEAADEAMFARRALAVEKERAIAENELGSRVELARRERALVDEEGANARRQAEEDAAAAQITAEATAARAAIATRSDAERVAAMGRARVEAEGERAALLRDLPPLALVALVAPELREALPAIGQLVVAPDMLHALVGRLVQGPEAGDAR